MAGFEENGKKLFLTLNLLPLNPQSKIFFKNQALSLLYFYGALTLCKNCRKNEWSLSYLKAHRQGHLLSPPPVC